MKAANITWDNKVIFPPEQVVLRTVARELSSPIVVYRQNKRMPHLRMYKNARACVGVRMSSSLTGAGIGPSTCTRRVSLAFCLKEQFPDKNLLIRVQADSRGARIELIILSRAALPTHLQFIPQTWYIRLYMLKIQMKNSFIFQQQFLSLSFQLRLSSAPPRAHK